MTNYEKLVETLRWAANEYKGSIMDEYDKDTMNAAADAIEALQAQLPKRGKWILKERAHYFKCSICKEPIPYKFGYGGNRYYNYCPRCGAKMEVQE